MSKSKCYKHLFWEHFLAVELSCQKHARVCGAKHISKLKWQKHQVFGRFIPIFSTQQPFAPSQKWARTRWFCSSFKNDGKRGASEEDLQRCISRGKRNARDISTRHADMFRVRAWNAEKGCILEHEIVRFAKMILRDRCVQHFLYCLASLFRGRHNTLERWDRQIANHIESSRSRQLCTHFSFLKDIPQNFLVFNGVNVECLRKSRRFWSCDLPFFEEFSQKCFDLDLSTSTFEESLA